MPTTPIKLDGTHLTAAFDYALPAGLIAQSPPARRDGSRLLVVDRARAALAESCVRDVGALLREHDLLVFNDTRVIKARVMGVRDDTGGRVEILFLRVDDGGADAMLRARGRLMPGVRIAAGAGPDAAHVTLAADQGGGCFRVVTDKSATDVLAWLDRVGRVPLPPYIRREAGADPRDAEDVERYQTVFAAEPGAVAAPTAGLHFSTELLADLDARGVRRATVTLHVGPGTFRPVTAPDVRDHVMHSERFEVDPDAVLAVERARNSGGRVVAVGTTVVRALESAARGGALAPASGSTDLFIHEPGAFRVVDALFTNFHAPRSTLLMLTCAFGGRDLVLRAYAHAIAAQFRLLSYGDAMVIL